MDSSIFTDNLRLPKLTQEIVQALVSYQLPSGDWARLADVEDFTKQTGYGKAPTQYIREPDIIGSLLSINQLRILPLNRFANRETMGWNWVRDQYGPPKGNSELRSQGYWLTVWPTKFSTQVQASNIQREPHVGFTALSGTFSGLNIGPNKYPREILYNLLRVPQPNILSLQNNDSGAWSNNLTQMYDQYATACCIEFCAKIWQLSHKKAQSYRYAYLRGIDWLRREMAKNDYYFVQNSIKSTYLTAIILSRIHHLLPKEFLWNALQNLIENSQQGTWVDETISDFEQKESSRYRTTVCVLNLFAKLPFRHDFIKESAFNGSLEFIFNRNVREEAEPRDLVFLLNIIDTLSEIKRVEKMINDEEIYDWWLPDNKSNTLSYSEIKRIDEFYQQWLEHSKRRSRGLQYGAFNLGNGYRIILREEEDLARQVRAFLKQNLKRLEREIFYRISLSDELPGLSPDILYRLRYAINKCGQLNNPNHLKAIFVDKRIFPWRGYIPDTGDLHEIIDRLIAFLYEKRHSETNKNGLVCFLEVLSDRLHKQDECHDIFKQLIIDLTR